MKRAVVVGAGPAGLAAAEALCAAGVAVVLVEEGRRPGGQVWRMPPPELALDMDALLGPEAAGFRGFHARFAALRPGLDWRPETLVWNVFGGAVHLVRGGRFETLAYDALVLATGATDRVVPLPGWTLPGVTTLGGAQVLLKDQGCLIGRRVVMCGSSPLLTLAALQYAGQGAAVAGVLDTTPFRSKLRALPKLLAAPAVLRKGLAHVVGLKARGVALHHGVRLLGFEGEDRVRAVLWRDRRGQQQRTECDAVAYGFGLRCESQLAELAGARMRFDARFRQWFPEYDEDGRCGEAVYVAGDGSRIGGADAAAASGRLAGLAAAADLGKAAMPAEAVALRSTLARLRRFQEGIAEAFAWPTDFSALADDVPVCRCESITVGELRAAVRRDLGAGDVNRAKAATRVGMGRCQGRFCGPAAAEIVAAERVALGARDVQPDRLRAQPPVKPLPFAAALDVDPS
jgi:NADPH-dependent 2,4-dienoyl-CoA reductase/sulfur reductase-like enzyme